MTLQLKQEIANAYIEQMNKDKEESGFFDFLKFDKIFDLKDDEIKNYLLGKDGTSKMKLDDMISGKFNLLDSIFSNLKMNVVSMFDGELKQLKEFMDNNTENTNILKNLKEQIVAGVAIEQAVGNALDPSYININTNNLAMNNGNLDLLTSNEGYIDKTLNLAYEYEGTKYQWGGTTSTTGFDCSGLWSGVFKDLYQDEGANFSRLTAEVFDNQDRNIDLSNVGKGDFMYWEDKDGVKHKKIYHIEMCVGKPFIENGKQYVMTYGASTDKGLVKGFNKENPNNFSGQESKKSGVGFRKREVTTKRHFGRPVYFQQLAQLSKQNKNQQNMYA